MTTSFQTRPLHIESTGVYLPKTCISNRDLEIKHGFKEGHLSQASGVELRRFADPATESNSKMAAAAARQAMATAGLTLKDIDLIIYASGSKEQLLPCNASLVQRELGGEKSGITSFDIDSTCLSFVVALDMVSYLLAAGRFQRALIVSSETATIALNWQHRESASLISDGAAAVIVRRSRENESSKIFSSRLETYSSGADDCRILGGGSRHNVRSESFTGSEDAKFLFEMNGRAAYKMAAATIVPLVEKLFVGLPFAFHDTDLFIPHQASRLALDLIREHLRYPADKWVNILADHGNMVAASIPTALHRMIERRRLQRGQKVVIVGTSAGFSIGGMVLEY